MQSEKAQTRTRLLAKRLGFDEAARKSAERKILLNVCECLKNKPSPGIVAGYAPIRGEVHALNILTALYQQGYEIALPVVRQDCDSNLEFRVHHPDAELLEGYSGILEPLPERDAVTPDIVLVPLLGFDDLCHRIGYGAGHYDRTFSFFKKQNHKVMKIGLAFELQKLAHVPTEPHDQLLDFVVTEAHVYQQLKGQIK